MRALFLSCLLLPLSLLAAPDWHWAGVLGYRVLPTHVVGDEEGTWLLLQEDVVAGHIVYGDIGFERESGDKDPLVLAGRAWAEWGGPAINLDDHKNRIMEGQDKIKDKKFTYCVFSQPVPESYVRRAEPHRWVSVKSMRQAVESAVRTKTVQGIFVLAAQKDERGVYPVLCLKPSLLKALVDDIRSSRLHREPSFLDTLCP